MAKEKTVFACNACGGTSPKWLGKCPHCDAWNTLIETRQASEAGGKNRFAGLTRPTELAVLSDIAASDVARTPTGQEELDRVLGGGIVSGAVILIGGDPGIGKSTILLQAMARMAISGVRTAYISGEEAIDQVRLRAARLGLANAPVALATATALIANTATTASNTLFDLNRM